eukprot:UN33595
MSNLYVLRKQEAGEDVEGEKNGSSNALGAITEQITISEKKDSDQKELTDEQRANVNKAVVVIKKSLRRKIEREEVFKFLKKRGMDEELIEIAYKEAQAKALNPAERIRYFRNLADEKTREMSNVSHENKKLKRDNTKLDKSNKELKEIVRSSVDLLMECKTKRMKQLCLEVVIKEVKEAIDR